MVLVKYMRNIDLKDKEDNETNDEKTDVTDDTHMDGSSNQYGNIHDESGDGKYIYGYKLLEWNISHHDSCYLYFILHSDNINSNSKPNVTS